MKINHESRQLGFTLLEIMIASAILAGIALAVAKLTQDQLKSAKTVEAKFDYSAILSDIRTILSDQASCAQTLGAFNAQSATGITQIISRTAAGVNVVRYVVNTSTAQNSTGTSYGAARLRINSISLDHNSPGMGTNITSPPNNTGSTTMVIRFWMGVNKTYTSQFLTQRLVLNVTTNGANNNIVSCSSAAADNSLNDLELACLSIDGIFDAGTGRCNQSTYVSLPPPMSAANTTAFSSVSTQFLWDWMSDNVNGLDSRYVRKIANVTEVMLGRLEMRGAAGAAGIGIYRGTLAAEVGSGGIVVNAGGLTVNTGNITLADGQVIQMNSDLRLKKNVNRLENQLSKLKQLKPSTYVWRSSGKKGTGFIAQELMNVFPDLVHRSPAGNLTVDYVGLTPIMLQGLKELEKENRSLRLEVIKLRSDLDKLTQSFCRNEPTLCE